MNIERKYKGGWEEGDRAYCRACPLNEVQKIALSLDQVQEMSLVIDIDSIFRIHFYVQQLA